MSHINPLQGCSNMFDALHEIGMGVSTLGIALQAVDMERIEDPDTFIRGIGYLAETIGSAVFELCDYEKREIEKVLQTPRE